MIDAGTMARVDRYLDVYYDISMGRFAKEIAVREIRKIERQTGHAFLKEEVPEDNPQFRKHMRQAKERNKNKA